MTSTTRFIVAEKKNQQCQLFWCSQNNTNTKMIRITFHCKKKKKWPHIKQFCTNETQLQVQYSPSDSSIFSTHSIYTCILYPKTKAQSFLYPHINFARNQTVDLVASLLACMILPSPSLSSPHPLINQKLHKRLTIK